MISLNKQPVLNLTTFYHRVNLSFFVKKKKRFSYNFSICLIVKSIFYRLHCDLKFPQAWKTFYCTLQPEKYPLSITQKLRWIAVFKIISFLPDYGIFKFISRKYGPIWTKLSRGDEIPAFSHMLNTTSFTIMQALF